MDLPPLDWLRTFEAAARLASFSAAAAELGLTQSAVSQRIGKLEARLGRKLFHRLARGVELTADGAAYLPHVSVAFVGLARSTGDLFSIDRKRRVSLASPASFATLWLAPRLARLAKDLPGLRLSVAAVHRPADYDSEQADLEIRFDAGDWSHPVSRRYAARRPVPLLPEVLSPVCTPELKARAPAGDWTALPRLALTGARQGWSEWHALARIPPPAPGDLRFDSLITALAAAKAGAGVLLTSLRLTQSDLDSGALVRLSPIELNMPAGHWLLAGAGRAATPDVAALRDWLARQATAEGREPAAGL